MSEFLPHPRWTSEQPQPEDALAMAEMQQKVWIETYCKGNTAKDKAMQTYADEMTDDPERLAGRAGLIAESLTSDSNYYKIVRAKGEPVGLIYGYKNEAHQELFALYVAKEYQGKGVGSTLATDLLKWFDPTRPVKLGVIEDNEDAQRFYEKLGFVPIPDSKVAFQNIPDTYEIRMERPPQEEIQ